MGNPIVIWENTGGLGCPEPRICGCVARGDPGEDTEILHVHSDLNWEVMGACHGMKGREEDGKRKIPVGNLRVLVTRSGGAGKRNHGGLHSAWYMPLLHLKIGVCARCSSSPSLWFSNSLNIGNIYHFFSMPSDAKISVMRQRSQ